MINNVTDFTLHIILLRTVLCFGLAPTINRKMPPSTNQQDYTQECSNATTSENATSQRTTVSPTLGLRMRPSSSDATSGVALPRGTIQTMMTSSTNEYRGMSLSKIIDSALEESHKYRSDNARNDAPGSRASYLQNGDSLSPPDTSPSSSGRDDHRHDDSRFHQ